MKRWIHFFSVAVCGFLLVCFTWGMGMAQSDCVTSTKPRMRDYGIVTGVMQPGPLNAITDVKGVTVGQVTLIEGDSVRTGVTAIIPHPGNVFQEKVPAGFYAGNGFGKLAGTTQIIELGNVETPIVLTNTLSVSAGIDALITYTLQQPGNEKVRSVNAVVGETNDGGLNDIRGRHVKPDHVLQALAEAEGGPVAEGNVGAGTGTVCFGVKGGIGTSSRVLPKSLGGYTVGVLAQTNFGGVLQIAGVNVGEQLGRYTFSRHLDGSCMMIIITDAPLNERNLERLAKRGMMGLARTGGIASNGSGDYVLALSVAPGNLIREGVSSTEGPLATYSPTYLHNDDCSALFLAAIEATEEAILNSLFAADAMEGYQGTKVDALPIQKVVDLFEHDGHM